MLNATETMLIHANQHPGIARLREKIMKWLSIPSEDADLIDFCLAVYKSNELPGDPLWGMIIDASGGGKTELLRAFRERPNVCCLSHLTEKTLVSGYRDPGSPDKDPSLLPELDGKVLVIKDLAPLLSMRRESRNAIFAQLRDAYDGFTDQGRGNLGKVSYEARFTMLVASTLAIERYDSVDQELGERFVKIRARGDAARDKVRKAIENVGQDDSMRLEIQNAISSFLDSQPPMTTQRVPDGLRDRLIDLSDFTAKARSPVARDSKHELQYVPRPEVGTRLGKELAKLLMALANIHGKEQPDEDEYAIVGRVADDCLPPRRLEVIQCLRSSEEPLSFDDLMQKCFARRSTLERTLEDLELVGAVTSFNSQEYGGEVWELAIKTK